MSDADSKPPPMPDPAGSPSPQIPSTSSVEPTAAESKRGFCAKCGCQLSRHHARGTCPECKQPVCSSSSETIPDGFLCYKCGYGLVGLPADGECPECSTSYSLSLAFRGKPHPGQFSLAIRLFWPIAAGLVAFIGLLLTGFGNSGGNISGFLGLCLAGAILVNLINLPIVSSTLSARYVPPHRRRRWSANMFFLGGWVGTAWVVSTIAAVITIAAPVIAFGACLMMAGGRY